MSEERQQAVQAIVAQMRAQGIALAEIQQALSEPPEVAVEKTRVDMAGRAFAWLGGALIFSGVLVYAWMFWPVAGSGTRIAVTLGIGLLIHALTLIALSRTPGHRAIVPGFIVAAILQTVGWFVLIGELFGIPEDKHLAALFVTAIMAVQQGAALYRYRLTALLFFLLCFGYGFLCTALDALGLSENLIAIIAGLSMVALAREIQTTPHAALSWLGYGAGSAMFYMGLFDLLEGTYFEILYLAAAVAGLAYVSARMRSTMLLVTSTFAVIYYIGYFTMEYFAMTIGWPLALMVTGAACIAVSGYALRVKRSINTH